MRGLAIAGFLAAFMSTVATQLNWGASYLVSDFYRRFLHRRASNRHYVQVSRLATVLLVIASAWVSVHLDSIASGWQVVMEVGAGTGAVYLLRWYWWRINAWSEISAMACSLAVTVTLNALHPFHGASPVVFAKTAMTTTAITTLVWIAVTFLAPAEPRPILEAFYRQVRPDVRGWKPIAAQANASGCSSPRATWPAISPPGFLVAPWSTSASSAPANCSSTNQSRESPCSLSPLSAPSLSIAALSPDSTRSRTSLPNPPSL